MRRIVNTEKRRAIEQFLRSCGNKQLQWLERVRPEYVWILRHMYGPLGSTVEELSRVSGLGYHAINHRRDQALRLLGFKAYLCAESARTIRRELAEFQRRQRLSYLREYYVLTPADLELIDLALLYGARACEISANSDWTLQTAFHALGRLCQDTEMTVDRPGERVRQRAFEELLAQRRNPKAELEFEILSQLDIEYAVVDLARDWEAEPTLLSAVVAEVRRELSEHRLTRRDFAKLNTKKSGSGAARGGLAVRTLNAKLLPLYRTFRRSSTPYSRTEREYLKLRIRGVSLTRAGRMAMGVNAWRAAAIDRAFLEKLVPEAPIEFPTELPLPPFTRRQNERMERLKYVRVS